MTMTRASSLRLALGAALAPVLAMALAGCVNLGGGKAPPTLFTLTAAAVPPAGETVSGNADSALVVLDPETDRALGVQRVAVTIDASNIAYLKNAMWAERPSRLFRHLLAETIRSKGGRLVFEDAEASASGRVRLAGRLLAFGYDAPSRAALVRFDAVREGAGGAITTRRFEASVPVGNADARLVAPALNGAANAVAAQVADWVG